MATKKKTTALGKVNYGTVQSLEEIRKALGRKVLPPKSHGILDTGSPDLNSVLGNDAGIPWGTIVEISGPNTQGKTALAIDLAATAQTKENAFVVWLSLESSFETKPKLNKRGKLVEPWPIIRGMKIDPDNLMLIESYTLETTEQASAEELLEECEVIMRQMASTGRRVFFVLDSVTALLPEKQRDAGITGQNMLTNAALASLLSNVFRRWVGMFQGLGMIGVFINQIRSKPGVMFGNPEYTTGGGAIPFYAHVRVGIQRRGKNFGRIRKGEKVLGIFSVVKNFKNKAGGIEEALCGYKIYKNGNSIVVPASEVEDEVKSEVGK